MADRHKTHQDMRLSEVTDAPCHERNKLDEPEHRAVHLRERREKRGVLRVDQIRRRTEATEHDCRAHRHNEDRKEHHHALDKVRARDGEKAPDERVEHNNARPRK